MIVVSGYSDFEYAKGALRYNTLDYILKHELTNQTVEQAIRRVTGQNPSSLTYREKSNDQGVLKLAGETDLVQQIVHNRPDFKTQRTVALVLFPYGLSDKNWDPERYRVKAAGVLQDIIKEATDYKYPLLTEITPKGALLCLISFAKVQSGLQVHEFMERLLVKLNRSAERLLNVRLFCKTSQPSNEIEKLAEEYFTENTYLNDLFYLENLSQGAFFNEKVVYLEQIPVDWPVKRLIAQVHLACEYFDFEKISQDSQEIFSELAEIKLTKNLAVPVIEQLVEAVDFPQENSEFSKELQDKLSKTYNLNLLKEYYNAALRKYLDEVYQNFVQKHKRIVFKIINYINENFSDEISLRSCAHSLDLNYSYVSRIFKEELQVSFVRYVNQLRVRRAEIYLGDEKLSINEIVDLCGFTSYNYFFKVFKEYTGMSPIDYRNQLNLSN